MKKITKIAVRMVNGDCWRREFDGEIGPPDISETEREIVWRDAQGVTVLAVRNVCSVHLSVEEVEG